VGVDRSFQIYYPQTTIFWVEIVTAAQRTDVVVIVVQEIIYYLELVNNAAAIWAYQKMNYL